MTDETQKSGLEEIVKGLKGIAEVRESYAAQAQSQKAIYKLREDFKKEHEEAGQPFDYLDTFDLSNPTDANNFLALYNDSKLVQEAKIIKKNPAILRSLKDDKLAAIAMQLPLPEGTSKDDPRYKAQEKFAAIQKAHEDPEKLLKYIEEDVDGVLQGIDYLSKDMRDSWKTVIMNNIKSSDRAQEMGYRVLVKSVAREYASAYKGKDAPKQIAEDARNTIIRLADKEPKSAAKAYNLAA